MPVLLRDLIGDPNLSITPLTSHCESSEVEVSWVATTELPDPAPFFRGGELVCTTALQTRSADEWRLHIASLLEVPIAGLCIGTGLIHDHVPATVIEIAEEAGLPLLNSPVRVPFIQISRWVADRIFADQYQLIQSMAAAQEDLLADLLAGSSLSRLVESLARRMAGGTQLALIDASGRLIAQTPEGVTWTDFEPGDGRFREPSARVDLEVPITVERVTIALLRCRSASPLVNMVSYAANILGLELGRRNAVRGARRMLASQIVEDLIEQSFADSELARRLQALGLDVEVPHVVVVGRAQRSAETLLQHPSSILDPFQQQDQRPVIATLGGDIVVLTPAETGAEVGRALFERLSDNDPSASVGIGVTHVGVGGLRASYFDARHALIQGPGIHGSADLSFSAVMIGSTDPGIRELAARVIQPLIDHDAEHHSSLVLTLRSYLDHDGSSGATCNALNLHRNSLLYRLTQIKELTNKDLTRTRDRFELWFALQSLENPHSPRLN